MGDIQIQIMSSGSVQFSGASARSPKTVAEHATELRATVIAGARVSGVAARRYLCCSHHEASQEEEQLIEGPGSFSSDERSTKRAKVPATRAKLEQLREQAYGHRRQRLEGQGQRG